MGKSWVTKTVEAIAAEVGVKLEGYQGIAADAAPDKETKDYVINPDKDRTGK